MCMWHALGTDRAEKFYKYLSEYLLGKKVKLLLENFLKNLQSGF